MVFNPILITVWRLIQLSLLCRNFLYQFQWLLSHAAIDHNNNQCNYQSARISEAKKVREQVYQRVRIPDSTNAKDKECQMVMMPESNSARGWKPQNNV